MTTNAKSVYHITRITAADTLPIRHDVMWPDKPLDFVMLTDDDKGLHFGLFEVEALVSVISLFIEESIAQFRKFATLQAYQGKGYGALLLNYVILEASKQGVTEIWCNSRIEKAKYYRQFGLLEKGEPFEKDGKTYVVMFKNL
jgi:GNAT superfamily N-acetyltransferase